MFGLREFSPHLILMQLLDDGRLTDGQARTAGFKNTVVIMTSNLGSDLIGRRRLGFDAGQDGGDLTERLMARLREAFRPEFLNRVDEIIIFRQPDETQLRQITSLLLEETTRRLHAQSITVDFTTEAVGCVTFRREGSAIAVAGCWRIRGEEPVVLPDRRDVLGCGPPPPR
jgi:ATP-dependent Clp protease ATP-binding subunit ClpC